MKKESDSNTTDPYDGAPVVIPLATTGRLARASGPVIPQKIPKRWGYELIYANDLYCCKLLVLEPNAETSMHLHLEKEETLVVVSGQLTVSYIKDKTEHSYTVNEGEAFTVSPGFPHALKALSQKVRLIEASTPSFDTDSIRIK
jgi:mannose-6-phosphate isomerase-like protein (cupin superfamily)